MPDLSSTISHAERLLLRRVAFHAEPHVFTPAVPATFPHLDHPFYDRRTTSLQSLGFAHLADVEDATTSRLHPDTRTFLRLLSGVSGTVLAVVTHCLPTRDHGADVPAPVSHLTQFITEFSDGRFIQTANTLHREFPREVLGVTTHYCRDDVPLTEMLLLHREAISQRMGGKRGVYATPVGDTPAATAALNRLLGLRRDHFRRVGYLPDEELAWTYGTSLPPGDLAELSRHVHHLALRRGLAPRYADRPSAHHSGNS